MTWLWRKVKKYGKKWILWEGSNYSDVKCNLQENIYKNMTLEKNM